MVNRRLYPYLLGGSLILVAIAINYGLVRYRVDPNPRQILIHVSGAPGMTVSGTFEIDSAQEASQEAELPAQFACTGYKVAFTCQRLAGPDQPISVAVDIDGIRRGTGTAAGGVRVDVWAADSEPRVLALPSKSEWKETKEAGRPPELIGTRPPEWTVVEWLNSAPLRLVDLRGKVVLARWFTGPVCDDCVATAPALREFHQRYGDQGLAVVGMFHHADSTLEEIQEIVAEYGYRFPVAVDRGAKTRRLWCLGRDDYGYTSVTFLLDRDGVIRYIHPGGRYVKGDADYRTLKSNIEQLLDEAPDREARREPN